MKRTIFFILCFVIATLSIFCFGCHKNKNENEMTGVVQKCAYNGQKIDWDDVSSDTVTGVTYDVSVNDVEIANDISTSEILYDFTEEVEKLNVVVTSNYNYNNENRTTKNSFELSMINRFDTPSLNYGVISWEAVENASGYYVNEGTLPATFVTGTTYELKAGTNSVRVKPIVNSEEGYWLYSPQLNVDIMASPTIHFEKSTKTIYWDLVSGASGYFLQIQKNGENVVDIPPLGNDATSYSEYQFLEEGEYKISIAAKGDSQTGKNDSKFSSSVVKRLSTPRFDKIQDRDNDMVFQWYALSNVNLYKVKLPSGSIVPTSENYVTVPLDTTTVETEYVFEVGSTSVYDNELDSIQNLEVVATRLAMVQNVNTQGGYITWNSVPKAQSYLLNVDGTLIAVDTNQYLLNLSPGSHTVKVKAIGNGREIVSSSFSTEVTINKLAAPTNLRIEESVLYWDSVDGCSSYSVFLDNGTNIYNSNTNSILINRSDISKSCSLYVVAKGNGNLLVDSNPSLTKALYIIDSPTVSVNRYGIEWTRIDNAVSYKVEIGDYVQNVTGTSFSFDSLSANTYIVYVTAIGNHSAYFDSTRSTVISVRKLSNPVVGIDNNGVNWQTVIDAQSYEVRIDSNNVEVFGKNDRNKSGPLFATSGTHTVSVRAIGDDINSVASSWTTISKDVYLLNSPTSIAISRSGNVLTFTAENVSNASGYRFNIGGIVNDVQTNVFEYTMSGVNETVLKVAALGNGIDYVDSNYTSEKHVIILQTPSGIQFVKQDNVLYTANWNAIQNATSYYVVVKKYANSTDNEPSTNDTYTKNANSITIDVEGFEKVYIEVTALGDGITIFDSDTCSAVKVISA